MTYLRRRQIPAICCGHCKNWIVDRAPSNLIAPDYAKTGECRMLQRVRGWTDSPALAVCFEREVGADDAI